VGFGFLYTPSVVIVGYYFYRRRALAVGITCCGSGLGALAFAPLLAVINDREGWRAATYFNAGLALMCLLACAAYRPIPSSAAVSTEKKSGDAADASSVSKKKKITTLEMNVLVAMSSATSIKLADDLFSQFEVSSVTSSQPSNKVGVTSDPPPPCFRSTRFPQQLVTRSETEVMRRSAAGPMPQPFTSVEAGKLELGDVDPHPSLPCGDLSVEGYRGGCVPGEERAMARLSVEWERAQSQFSVRAAAEANPNSPANPNNPALPPQDNSAPRVNRRRSARHASASRSASHNLFVNRNLNAPLTPAVSRSCMSQTEDQRKPVLTSSTGLVVNKNANRVGVSRVSIKDGKVGILSPQLNCNEHTTK
jgi:hypothetical protein